MDSFLKPIDLEKIISEKKKKKHNLPVLFHRFSNGENRNTKKIKFIELGSNQQNSKAMFCITLTSSYFVRKDLVYKKLPY